MVLSDTEKGLSKTFHLVKGAVYETLYLCAKQSGVKSWWFYLCVLVDFFQLLAFPVQHALYLGRKSDAGIKRIYTAFLAWISLTDEAFESVNQRIWVAIYSITGVWTLTYLSLIVLIGYRFSANVTQSTFSLKLLRSVAMLSSTILFLPFVSVLLRTFQCTGDDGGWSVEPSAPCFGAAHISFTVLVAIILPCFILVSVFIAAVFFERDLKSNVANAQVHGRGDMLMLVNKVMLSLLFGVLSDSLSPWILQLFLFASSLCYLFVYMVHMPHLNFRINEVKCAAASGLFLVCFAPFILLLDPGHDIGGFFLLALVVGPITGALLCRIRHSAILVKDLEEMDTSHNLSICLRRARKRIQVYEVLQKKYTSSVDSVLIRSNGRNQNKEDYNGNRVGQTVIPPTESSILEQGDTGVVLHRISSFLDQVEKAYRELVERYPRKGLALLEASTFYRHYHTNLYMEMLMLSKAHRECSSLDTQLAVYQRLKQLREGSTTENPAKHGSSAEGSMNAVDRVLFDHRWKTARNEETNVRKYVYQLWQTLMSACPDFAQMRLYAENLTKAMETADEQYQECLRLNSNSAKVLRAYGQFLEGMKGDVDKASEYLNKADRMEESAQRNKQEKVNKFIVFDQCGELEHNDESSAVIIISGDPSHIGEILEVNAAASNLFGRSKSELIGSNVSTIIPSPFAEVHDLYLRRFAKTGKSFVINRTRSLFGKTGSNMLIPLIMHFREVPPDQQQTVVGPRFSAVIHSPKTSENFMLFDNENNGFTILHADSRTHSIFLGIEPNQLEHLDVSLSHYLPQLNDNTRSKNSDRSNESRQSELTSFGGLPRNIPKGYNHKNKTENQDILHVRDPGSNSHNIQGDSDDYEENQKDSENWDSFLKKLQRRDGEYEEIFTRNTADAKTTKLLARVQTVDVPDYGSIYLLAWKPKGRKENQQNKELTQRFDIPQKSSCPFSQDAAAMGFSKMSSQSLSYSCTTAKETFSGSLNSPEADELPLISNVEPTEHVTTQLSISKPQVTASPSPPFGSIKLSNYETLESKNEHDGQNEHQSSPIMDSWGNPQPMAKQERRYRRTSVGKSSTGTSKSVTNLLRFVIRSGATGLNHFAQIITWLLVGLLIVYIVLAALSSVKLNDFYGDSFGQAVNVDQGGSEMNSYFGLQLSALKMFTTNSVYKNTVEDQSKLWTTFDSQANMFIDEALKSRSHSRAIGGSSHQWSLEASFEIQDKSSEQTEIVSFDELREFILSHVRELRMLQNSSEFRPTNSPHGASLLLDNSAVIKMAMESSVGERISQFMSFIDKSQSFLLVITFSLLTVLCISTLSVICYSLYNINVKKKNILKTFLLLASPVVKKLRDAAATSLREHVETVNRLELTIADVGSESSRTLESDMEEEDEENSPSSLLKPRTGTETSEPGQKGNKSTNQQYYSPPHGSRVIPEDTCPMSESKYASRNVRQHKDTSKAMFLLLAQITSPLVVLLVWGIITFTNSSSAMSAARQEVKQIRVSQNMFNELLEYNDQMNLLALRVPFPQLVFGNASQEQLEQFRDRVTYLQRSVIQSSTSLVEGGRVELAEGTTSLNTLSSSRKLYDVWQRDGCSVLSEQVQTTCQEVDLRNGLRSFLRAIFNRGNEIIAELPPVNEDNDLALEKILNSRQLQKKLKEFNSLFYPLPSKIMEWISDHLLESISTQLDDSLEAHRVATAVCVVLFAILVVIVSVPVMQKLTQTLVALVSLLVLIPESAIRSNRALRYQVKDVTQSLVASSASTEDAAILSLLSSD